MPIGAIKFGGGTALAMYYFQHRLSFDIDLFLADQQFLSFYSPKLWIDSYTSFNDSEYIDTFNHIGVITSNDIKIDILVDPNTSEKYVDNSKKIFPFDIHIETIEDIISKKIVFRKKDNKTRDIFDIAISIVKDDNLISRLLSSGKIEQKDLVELYEALSSLNINKYNSQIEIIEPLPEYNKIANNAPTIILEKLESFIP